MTSRYCRGSPPRSCVKGVRVPAFGDCIRSRVGMQVLSRGRLMQAVPNWIKLTPKRRAPLVEAGRTSSARRIEHPCRRPTLTSDFSLCNSPRPPTSPPPQPHSSLAVPLLLLLLEALLPLSPTTPSRTLSSSSSSDLSPSSPSPHPGSPSPPPRIYRRGPFPHPRVSVIDRRVGTHPWCE